MQALKALVIIMGILIVVGTTVVVVTIYKRMNRPAGQPAARITTAPPPGFGEAVVPIPEGCKVTALAPAGERLVLQLGSGGACDQILILDMGTGNLLGRLTLAPATR